MIFYIINITAHKKIFISGDTMKLCNYVITGRVPITERFLNIFSFIHFLRFAANNSAPNMMIIFRSQNRDQ